MQRKRDAVTRFLNKMRKAAPSLTNKQWVSLVRAFEKAGAVYWIEGWHYGHQYAFVNLRAWVRNSSDQDQSCGEDEDYEKSSR